MVERICKCVVCGKEMTTLSNRGKRFCSSECRNEYIRNKKNGKQTEEQEKFGSTPEEYAERQKEKTMAMLPKIEVPKTKAIQADKSEKDDRQDVAINPMVYTPELLPTDPEPTERVEPVARKLNEHDRSILVYMKGLINGARLWFGEDREPNQIFDKLLAGINALLDEEDVEL